MLLLFLILLGALIISVLFGIKIKGVEGFIGYNVSGDIISVLSNKIDGYGNTLCKLFDNDYYDELNGNVVLLDGSGSTTATPPVWDSTIYGLTVVSRDGSHQYIDSGKGNKWTESTMGTIKESYTSWDKDISNSFSQNHLYYIPYNKDTYVYVCDTSSANIGHHCYRFNSSGSTSVNGLPRQHRVPVVVIAPTAVDASMTSATDNTMVKFTHDDINATLLQLRPGIFYDKLTGYIMTAKNTAEKPTIYTRKGAVVTVRGNMFRGESASDDSLNSFVIKQNTQEDAASAQYVVVMTNDRDTIILAIANNKLDYAWRLDPDGNNLSGKIPSVSSSSGSNDVSYNTNLYYGAIQTDEWWNDYMRKTQIVPPVCPACPSCPTSGGAGTCVNCGGGGGVGGGGIIGSAVGTTGNVANNAINTAGGLVHEVGATAAGLAGYTLGSATGLARDTVSGTVGLAKDTASGTAGLARDAASGTYGAAKDVVSGTVGLGKDVVSGTVGLGKDAVNGTAGFIKSLGSGATQLSSGSGANPGYQGNPQYPTGPLDPYTYNGALTKKPEANFVPVTADFSRFGR